MFDPIPILVLITFYLAFKVAVILFVSSIVLGMGYLAFRFSCSTL
jgi:hypothetical protein